MRRAPLLHPSQKTQSWAVQSLGDTMAIDRRAAAYAEQFHGLFISRYTAAARAGRSDLIPEPIRDMIVCYVKGVPSSNPVDVVEWTKDALYAYRVKNGRDCPLPPEVQTVGQAALSGAAAGAKVGLGLVARSLFRAFR